METLTSQEEHHLTDLQAQEFLEERRGLYDLPPTVIKKFSQLIHQFEKDIHIASMA